MIRVRLDKPTRDGDREIVLVSNLPGRVRAAAIAACSLARGGIEGHFQRLTDYLHCEVPSLGYPRAALFAFAMSVIAGNALAVVEAAIRAAQGAEAAESLSWHAVACQVAGAHRGMMLALPPPAWEAAERQPAKVMARLLRRVAGHADMATLRKSVRGPKVFRRTPNCGKVHHVSTYHLRSKTRLESSLEVLGASRCTTPAAAFRYGQPLRRPRPLRA